MTEPLQKKDTTIICVDKDEEYEKQLETIKKIRDIMRDSYEQKRSTYPPGILEEIIKQHPWIKIGSIV